MRRGGGGGGKRGRKSGVVVVDHQLQFLSLDIKRKISSCCLLLNKVKKRVFSLVVVDEQEEEEEENQLLMMKMGSSLINNNNNNNIKEGGDCDDCDRLSSQQPSTTTTNHHPDTAKVLTLPTILTLGRVAAVPLLVSTFYMSGWWATTATTSIFIVAAITDWLDGYLARKMRLGTPFGAFLDPVADKLMVAATLVLLCTGPLEVAMFKEVPWILPVPSVAIIGREITMSAVREWAASQNSRISKAVAVNNLGKLKTATQMISLTILLATRDSSLTGAGILVGLGVFLLYISAGLAVWSLVVYVNKIWRVLLK